jgi:hypothetical protein
MAETALVVLLPELEPLIGGWRRRYTGDSARGMPPHVTLIFPLRTAPKSKSGSSASPGCSATSPPS